jgi:hypothetical protein
VRDGKATLLNSDVNYLGRQRCGFSEFGSKKTGKYGFIDSKGKVFLEDRFDETTPFRDGFSAVSLDTRWIIINHLGIFLDSVPVEEVKAVISRDRLVVSGTSEDRWSQVTDFFGNPISEKFSFIASPLPDSNAYLRAVSRSGNFGFLDVSSGFFHENPRWNEVSSHNGKYGSVRVGDQWILLNEKFEPIKINKKPVFLGTGNVNSMGEVPVLVGSGWGVYDIESAVFREFGFPQMGEDIVEGLAKVGRDGKFGFIDTKGRIVIDVAYDDVDHFMSGIGEICTESGDIIPVDKIGKPLL